MKFNWYSQMPGKWQKIMTACCKDYWHYAGYFQYKQETPSKIISTDAVKNIKLTLMTD
jgi:hypothetical protein